jgi:DNA-binding transcriptional MerR regulator/effector-binding domain-containing protein
MFKIGDFSRLAQVSVRMLRHYDKLGLLEPSYTDRFTGYRYYTIDQLPRLNRIVALNDLGLTLAQISDLLGKDDKLPAEQLRGMLALRRAELARELEEKRWQLASVEARLQQIETENDPEPYEIVVKSLESVPVASLRHMAPSVYEVGYFCETLYGQLYQRLGRLGVAWGDPEMSLYHNEEYTERDIDMEVAVPVAPEIIAAPPHEDHLCFRTIEGSALAAALIFEGPFEGVIAPIQALLRWIGLHDHASVGALRELHLSGPAHDDTCDALRIIELQVPIAPIAALSLDR